MEKFTTLSGIAVPMPTVNIDTDAIIPKTFLSVVTRNGLGKNLFNDLRYDADGAERPDFILNRAPYRDARILVAGANFGCGSSREHAVWSLADFGIRCVIAPSFADIFFNNCAKNGLLLVTLKDAEVEALMADAEAGAALSVDLAAQTIGRAGGGTIRFDIEPGRKHMVLNGLDEIGLTLAKSERIAAFEAARQRRVPWLAPGA